MHAHLRGLEEPDQKEKVPNQVIHYFWLKLSFSTGRNSSFQKDFLHFFFPYAPSGMLAWQRMNGMKNIHYIVICSFGD
jgi:hypothetical protein